MTPSLKSYGIGGRCEVMQHGAVFAICGADGYDDAVSKTARLTDARIELTDEEREEFDYKQQYISTLDSPTVTVTYFVPDARKAGGAYVTHTGTLKRVDEFARELVFEDGTRVALDAVTALNCEKAAARSNNLNCVFADTAL